MNKVWFYVTTVWRSIIVTTIAAAGIIMMLFFQLGSLPGGFHAREVTTNNSHVSFSNIIQQPLDAPFYTLRAIGHRLHPGSGILVNRVAAASFGFFVVVAFYALLRSWYSLRVAALGSILLASSSWFLRVGRIGLPDILQATVIVFVTLVVWFQKTKLRKTAALLITLTAAILLYIPGLVWIVILGFVWRGKTVVKEMNDLPRLLVVGYYFLTLLLISPLVLALIRTPSISTQLIGLPPHFQVAHFVSNLIHLPSWLFIKAKSDPVLFIGRQPLLDIFTSFMVILGLYNVLLDIKLDRSKLTLGLLVIGVIISCLRDDGLLSPLLVPVFLLATAGIAYMLDEWFRVFPRNPLARSIAAILVSVAVLLTIFYHVTNYFIAWPNAPATRATFTHQV